VGVVTLKVEAICNQTPPQLQFSVNPGNSISKAETDKFGRQLEKKPGIQTGPNTYPEKAPYLRNTVEAPFLPKNYLFGTGPEEHTHS